MPRAKEPFAVTLTVDGLWNKLWDSRIRDFEHDPRLTEIPEADRVATRLRWVASATKALKGRGFGTPRERRDAGEPVVFRRYLLKGNPLVAEHAFVSDLSIKWLAIDHLDRITVAENAP